MTAELRVRLQPRRHADEVAGERAGSVLVRVSAPPVDGRANEALCALIADRAGVSRSSVTILRGAASRDKVLRIEGIDDASLRSALGLTP